MAVKYLSEEWASSVTDALRASSDFKAASAGKSVKIQQVVTGAPQGEVRYNFDLSDGEPHIALGDLPDAEATITQDYPTAVGIDKGELHATAAFMRGKVKISGNLMKLMQLQSVIGTVPTAVSSLDIDY